MTVWPHDWRERTMRAAGIPKTQAALDILAAWRRSTPVEPWTNNPLGMPAHGSNAPRALGTPYAFFFTIGDFTAAFKRTMKSSHGMPLLHLLISADDLPATWRAIHALKWPANDTETDYPSVLLDMIERKYRDQIQTAPKAQRKSSGTQLISPDVHTMMRQQGYALHNAAKTFTNAGDAISFLTRRLG